MEIKNKLINTKEYQKKVTLNKKMKKKAKKHEKIDIKSGMRLEQSLYGSFGFPTKTTKNEKGKFIKLNKKITLLYLFSKSEIDALRDRFIKMFYENPMNENILSTIIDNSFREKFEKYKRFSNFSSIDPIGCIEPKKILELVKFIDILIFNFSDNYLGIAFECNLDDKILSEINDMITCDIDDNLEYVEYFVGSKKHIKRTEWNPDIVRKNKLDYTLIEIKCIINDFLNSYLKFEKETIYVPISLNIYETNYDIDEMPSSMMISHNMFGYGKKYKVEQFLIGEHLPKKIDEVFKTDICFESYNGYNNIERSSNLYIYTKSDKRNLFLIHISIIEIYISILYFYKLYEFEEIIAKERNNIFSIYLEKRNKKIYKSHNIFLNEILKYKTLFSNIVPSNEYINDYFKNIRKNQDEHCEKLIEDCKKLEKYFEDKLSIENIIETRKVSYISLIIAVLSIIIAIIPIIYDSGIIFR